MTNTMLSLPRVNSHHSASANWKKKNQEIKRDRGENKRGMENSLSQETVEMTATHREGKLAEWTVSRKFYLPQVYTYSFTGVKSP